MRYFGLDGSGGKTYVVERSFGAVVRAVRDGVHCKEAELVPLEPQCSPHTAQYLLNERTDTQG